MHLHGHRIHRPTDRHIAEAVVYVVALAVLLVAALCGLGRGA